MGLFRPPWWNWHTQQVEGLCPVGRTGSSPVGGMSQKKTRKDLACQVRAAHLTGQFLLLRLWLRAP